MASVVSNSVSGEWMSTNQMAQEFAGLPPRGNAVKTCSPRINLYLPLHHHVESVHFTHADGRTLHPALAIVQTPGREYYILKDNGMQVGCEEDGVAGVWMQVLGCSNRGLEDKRMQGS
ncbi:hypothetical protein SERLA73DRAFT_183406 [Serpula lacrymans var. lacrymans S7.3]|uniref:Uncharacterized protein n=2 Tax=Serpula lacrymans var. lacrymans TaxID=341189 RepID=F8PZT9_SERL3|nr:uncharacterized protein SERLADRAFT_470514 [Serpula lacrymans var. lacrymans S7.9]EGN98411.1 hypothetical protein SERLA73DRAFT_183406 [Serpula lacrymans var. lacrymans S7.3]EGO23963.1 hypothetical protein SERLADRAFT_470514 [Serpula lacrymans var. lacrymans S7.9]